MFLYFYFFGLHLILSSCEWKYEMKDYVNIKLKYTLVSTRITTEYNNETVRNNLKTGVVFKIFLKSKLSYDVFIKEKAAAVINTRTEFYFYEDDRAQYYNQTAYSCELVEGFVVQEEYSSYVIGYVEDVFFYGQIQIFNTAYYIEKLENYPELKHNSTKNAIAFKRTFLPDSTNNTSTPDLHFNTRLIVNANSKLLFKRMAGKGKMCALLVLIDNSFLRNIHGGNVKAAIKQVLLTIDEANSLFRSTDFDEDGYPDNIGFLIKYFIILKKTNKYRWIPKFTNRPIDGRFYMSRFSQFYLMEEVCLGVAFTGQSFHNDIVGISYTAVPADKYFRFPYGGICDRPMFNPFGVSLNTLAVSAKSTDGRTVPQYIFDLSLCHELGHSFGADHDLNECDGYLMTSHAPMDQQRKHFLFSVCSKRTMLRTILRRGSCFETDETPYCGNGLLESGEECDCGTIRDCLAFDSCCVPHGRKNACKIKRELGYQCHPSQGLCCSNSCYYNNFEKYDLDCRNFQRTCPCENNLTECKCGVQGKCIEKVCSSIECTRIESEECHCPKAADNPGCVTCCKLKSFDVSCAPANVVTNIVLNTNKELLEKLTKMQDLDKNSYNLGFQQEYCNGETCVQLHFRSVKADGYCLLFGQVGLCSPENTCLLLKQHPLRMPFLPEKRSQGTRWSQDIQWLSIIFFVISICILFL